MTPDTINGCFEFGMAAFAARSICILHRDKRVRGVSWGMIVFATLWGYWSLFYYPSLGQWFSFTGGAVLVMFNTTWVCQALYWMRRERAAPRALTISVKGLGSEDWEPNAGSDF